MQDLSIQSYKSFEITTDKIDDSMTMNDPKHSDKQVSSQAENQLKTRYQEHVLDRHKS